MHACGCARINQKTGIKGVYLRFKRMTEIYRGDVENEIKMQKKRKNICTVQKKVVTLRDFLEELYNKLYTIWKKTTRLSRMITLFP